MTGTHLAPPLAAPLAAACWAVWLAGHASASHFALQPAGLLALALPLLIAVAGLKQGIQRRVLGLKES